MSNTTTANVEQVINGFVSQLQDTSAEVSRDFLNVSCNAIRRAGKVTAMGANLQINAGLLNALLNARAQLIKTIDRFGEDPAVKGIARQMVNKFDTEFRGQLGEVFEETEVEGMLTAMPLPAILSDEREIVAIERDKGRFASQKRLTNGSGS